LPLAEEIAEGFAWNNWRCNPDSETAAEAYTMAFNALQSVCPHTGIKRCAECGTTKWGRGNISCGYCGSLETLQTIWREGDVHWVKVKTSRPRKE
jgi:hypothetical protein